MTYYNIDSADGNSLSEGIQSEVEARRIAQSTANRLGASVYLYEVGRTADKWWAWHDQDSDRHSVDMPDAEERCAAWVAGDSDDGPEGVESEEVAPEETEEDRVARAAKRLNATEIADGQWAHYAQETSRWYVMPASDLADLCDYLDSPDPQVSGDAYSHWCAGSTSEEMPRGWSPELLDKIPSLIDDVKFTTPPENQGQIVITSYGCDGDYIYARTEDLSDRTVSVAVYEHPENAKEGDFEPWNCVPELGDKIASIDL